MKGGGSVYLLSLGSSVFVIVCYLWSVYKQRKEEEAKRQSLIHKVYQIWFGYQGQDDEEENIKSFDNWMQFWNQLWMTNDARKKHVDEYMFRLFQEEEMVECKNRSAGNLQSIQEIIANILVCDQIYRHFFREKED